FQRNLLGGIVKEHEAERITRVLGPDQMRERQRNALRRSESILAVKDHAVARVEQQDRRTGAFVFGLADHQIVVLEVEGNSETFARHGMKESRADVEIERVAEFVFLRSLIRFDTGGEVRGLVAAEAAAAERAEQVTQKAESKEVDGFVRQFESRGTGRHLFGTLRVFVESGWRRLLLLGLNPSFLNHLADELI